MAVDPPSVVTGDILEFTFDQELDGQMCLNVLHYRVDEGAATDIQAVTTALLSYWKGAGKLLAKLWILQTEKLLFYGLKGQVIHPTRTAYSYIALNAEDGPGNQNGPLPSNVTAVITKRSTETGRSKHGDFFIPGITDEYVSESTITAEGLIEYNAVGAELAKDVTAAGLTLRPIIYHPGKQPVYDDVWQTYTHHETRVMRRRTVGLGK